MCAFFLYFLFQTFSSREEFKHSLHKVYICKFIRLPYDVSTTKAFIKTIETEAQCGINERHCPNRPVNDHYVDFRVTWEHHIVNC